MSTNSVAEEEERRFNGDRDQHGFGLTLSPAILLLPCERHLTGLSSAWRFWQVALNFSHMNKFKQLFFI